MGLLQYIHKVILFLSFFYRLCLLLHFRGLPGRLLGRLLRELRGYLLRRLLRGLRRHLLGELLRGLLRSLWGNWLGRYRLLRDLLRRPRGGLGLLAGALGVVLQLSAAELTILHCVQTSLFMFSGLRR